MTIAILSFILLSYMKITGKTLPKVEKLLNKVKNAKQKEVVTELTSVVEKEISSIDVKRLEEIPFKKSSCVNTYAKPFSGSLRI